jgi:hypothetical protein
LKTLAELGSLEVGKSYRLHIPACKFPEVIFNPTIKDYKVIDKVINLSRMKPYQVAMAAEDRYYCCEDGLGNVVLFEVKPDYLIEEI